jgi:hypothetical protein
MAQKYSTALVNLLTGGRNLRSILDDCVLRILSGPAPTDADQQETGTLLCIVSKSSLWISGETGPSSENWYFGLPALGPTAANVIGVNIDIDGSNTLLQYPIVAADTTITAVAAKLANMINQSQRPVRAIAGPSGASGPLVGVSPIVRGLSMTLAAGTGTTGDSPTPTKIVAAARYNSLQFGPPVAGVISKLTADTWTGVNLAAGVGGYFRLVLPGDSFGLDSAFVYARVQGSLGTSGADLNLDSVQFVVSATTTISGFALQEPMSA